VSRVLVVRHAQSTWNADGRWQGQADPPLSPLGEAQATAARRLLEPVDGVWSSDLERARRTAVVLARSQDRAVRLEPRVRERDAGAWTGLTRAEIESQYPGYLPTHRRPSDYEADPPLLARVLEALQDVAACLAGGTGLVVTHGGVIIALERYFGAEAAPVPNLAGRWVHAEDGDVRLGDRTLLLDPDDVRITLPGQP
jgi:probable phosphoglycerate mutase